MKKLLFVVCLIILILPVSSFAGKGDLFDYNRAGVEVIFSDLDELENYINMNDGITLSTLQSTANGLSDIGSDMLLSSVFSVIEPPLGVPSIVWGFFLGPVGVAVVYFMTEEDKEETKKAFYGCIGSGVLWVGFAVLRAALWRI